MTVPEVKLDGRWIYTGAREDYNEQSISFSKTGLGIQKIKLKNR